MTILLQLLENVDLLKRVVRISTTCDETANE
jgi:hypothetical protein